MFYILELREIREKRKIMCGGSLDILCYQKSWSEVYGKL